MATIASKGTVFVSGASGYIAGHVIHQLLEAGYKVKGSVRSLSNPTKVAHLQSEFPGVELVEADLLIPGSFDAGIAGCDYVLHTASPFQTVGITDPQAELVDPAVKGTENVLGAAAKAGVKRVVVTSSCAAVANEAPYPEGTVLTEANWNEDSTLESGAYRLSKTLAERRAWELAETASFSLVVVNPSFVLGPPFSKRTDSTSVRVVKTILEGGFKDGAPASAAYGTVDVRDLGHVRAMETESASGRYIFSSSVGLRGMMEVADILRSDPEFAAFHSNLPTASVGEAKSPTLYDHSKAERELGVTFKERAETLKDMARWLIANGVATPPASE